jgi:hypothetical protein
VLFEVGVFNVGDAGHLVERSHDGVFRVFGFEAKQSGDGDEKLTLNMQMFRV